MSAEARISSLWSKQKLFVAIFLMAISGWFAFDGLVGYPRSNARWLAYDQHNSEGRLAEWPAYAKSQGWILEQPHKLFKKEDIFMQFACGGLAFLLGTIVLVYWTTQVKGRLISDETGVITPAGTRVPFEAITGLGMKRWESKGIATVRYEIKGSKGQFVIDDYKFDTEPSRKILQEIEEHLRSRTS